MGYGPVHLPLDVAQEHTAVPSGKVFNGVTVSSVPRGLAYYVRFGNTVESGPWEGRVTWTFGPGVPRKDVSEGLFVRVLVAVPNARMSLQISYET
jgi:hypothetical protein